MRVARLVALILAAALTACSSPSPVLYTIAPVQGPAQTSGPKVVALQQISMARYLERPQWGKLIEPYLIAILWWRLPLHMLPASDLPCRIGGSTLFRRACATRLAVILADVQEPLTEYHFLGVAVLDEIEIGGSKARQ
jgi:hypothetical protein